MDRTERFYRIDQLLHERRVVPIEVFLASLEVSRATFKRDLEYMRDRLNAPIVWDRERGGYRFEAEQADHESYALPGLWFNAAEIHALLTMQQLLTELQPGLLGPHIEPLLGRIRALLEDNDHSVAQIEARIRVLHMAARSVAPRCFEVVSSALLSRKRVHLEHYNRERDRSMQREVSPQRLVHYRDNWYLDAWCHQRNALRSFSLDSISKARCLDTDADELCAEALDAELGSGYGIFAGRNTELARLRFSNLRSRWVARERWHPEQSGEVDEQGRYVLEVPYSDRRELLMDVLRHGPDVEVLGPPSLINAVREALQRSLRHYQD